MKTKLFTGLALAVALLIGPPAFAHSDRGKGGRSHTVAVVHRSGGGSHKMVAVRGGSRGFRGTGGRTFVATKSFAASGRSGRTLRTSPSMAFGGNSYNSRNGRGGGNPTYAFASHNGWNHGQEYSWHGHHYHWMNNGWFIIDAFPYEAYYPSYGYGPATDSVAVRVQQDLAHDGYYQGPIDGVVGPGTRAAIASYQRDNELPPTGVIDSNLLNSLNGG